MFKCACFSVHPKASDSTAICSGMMEHSLKSDHAPKPGTLPTQGDEDACVGYRVLADTKTHKQTHIHIHCHNNMLFRQPKVA